MSQCTICGHPSAPEAVFCSRCGARLAPREQTVVASAALREIARELEQTLQEHPNNADAHYQLAIALMYDGRWGAAAEHLMKVTHMVADFADAHANLAICLAHLGQLGHASEAIKVALALDPSRDRFQRLRAQLDRAAGGQ